MSVSLLHTPPDSITSSMRFSCLSRTFVSVSVNVLRICSSLFFSHFLLSVSLIRFSFLSFLPREIASMCFLLSCCFCFLSHEPVRLLLKHCFRFYCSHCCTWGTSNVGINHSKFTFTGVVCGCCRGCLMS